MTPLGHLWLDTGRPYPQASWLRRPRPLRWLGLQSKILLLEGFTKFVVLLGTATMGFLDHLEELRRRMIICLLALVSGFGICFAFSGRIFAFLMGPLSAVLPEGAQLIATTVPEIFMLHLKMSFFAGIFMASPVIVAQAWLFVSPGLYQREKRFAVPFVLSGTFFFLLGAFFAHHVVFPYGAKFLVGFGSNEIGIMLTVSSVFSFYSRIVLAMGIVFEIPTLAFVLTRLGLITSGFLWRKASYSVVAILLLAALITPTGDVVNLALVALPMVGLYFLSIAIAWVFRSKPSP